MININCKQRKQRKLLCNVPQLFLGFLLLFMVLPASADIPQITPMQETHERIVTSQTQQMSLKEQAKQWGLTTEGFKQYLWLMRNTPSGHWYRQLDPAEVLALNSKDPDEMMYYAKIQARNMHVRVTRELAFNKIYSKAYKVLYPNEKAIMPYGSVGLIDRLQSGDRVWLFVGIDTPLGHFAYQHLIKLIQATPNTVLDIYFVGKKLSKSSIQSWAVSARIQHDSVNKQVTLNYGNYRFNAIRKGKYVNLPFVGVVHDGHFQPITLSSIL